jgi:hypothetical protein
MAEKLGKLTRIYYDGTAIAMTVTESVSRKGNTQNVIHKDNAGLTATPLYEKVLLKSKNVTFSGDAYYADAGSFKTLNIAWDAGEVNPVALKSVLAGGDTENFTESLIVSLDDDHPVEEYSKFKFQIQAFGTRTLGTTP